MRKAKINKEKVTAELVAPRLLLGRCEEVMKPLGANLIDATVCDPPYGLEFMGKEWDRLDVRQPFRGEVQTPDNPFGRSPVRYASASSYGGSAGPAMQEWHLQWAREALRVLKPGGHIVAFGGSRTYHRLACALEDAGFEIRDSLMWLYGTGFPKSLNVGDGRGTALKPAHEPIVLARKPLEGTVAANVQKWGTGMLNIDACRIHSGPSEGGKTSGGTALGQGSGWNAHENRTTGSDRTMAQGRWPANVVLDEEAGALLDAQAGERKSGSMRAGTNAGRKGLVYAPDAGRPLAEDIVGSSGGASRFFYCAKTSRAERDEGCGDLYWVKGTLVFKSDWEKAAEKDRQRGNIHPTVKPAALMEWLIKLVTPPNGTVLDPFLGSGSTGVAAQRLALPFVGIEMNADYLAIAKARMKLK